MIAHLRGTVTAIGATWVVVDLGGFGVKALCTPATASGVRLDQPTELHTSLVVREDSLTLYAFAGTDERDCFELAQSASGIGPKIAQAMMSVLSPDEFRTAIASGDHKTLTRVPGIGTKGAQKMVLELKDKVNALGAVTDLPAATGSQPEAPVAAWREQVSQGLQGLGWSAKDAEAACDRVAPLAESETSVAVLMRAALQTLARK
ncbi:Holliday junction DNA helicase subunit RuvA [Propionibacteriaceae bacterium ES.041]|uniref:Holliday junction branch migration protein RuvA n=1 Tax=Enemella evansiae TaxID=2016499 RepID=UPI000B978D59|nr:Holliday junction branch migration protein RuvA [Enemella evansiae]OYN96106.1 Holliday junction branch migration protein RuvA [Enemella evansiae]OYN99104.1 Holliday junction branch migration protein RuvA [Enemella evansiae]OYO15665.1 Holliday junction branch migration protein RuvA [Enemella evansiae]PFG67368.1 Holliday junction DNA helicase subunit RuvA [Propionibacteriaceae bacterium ES.041]